MDSSWLPPKAQLSYLQRARMIDILNQRKDANPPIPHIEPGKIAELRQLIESGDEYLAYQEYLHIAQVATGKMIAKATALQHTPSEPSPKPAQGYLINPPTKRKREAPVIGQPSIPEKKKHRVDGLRVAILAGMANFEKKYGTKPNPRTLFDWIGKNDETGVIIELDENKDELVWMKKSGGISKTGFHAFENRMTKINAEKSVN